MTVYITLLCTLVLAISWAIFTVSVTLTLPLGRSLTDA